MLAGCPAVTGWRSTRRVVTESKSNTVFLYSIVAAAAAGKPWTGGWDDQFISCSPTRIASFAIEIGGSTMSPETIRALASEIVSQTIVGNWTFYAVLACLTILLSAGGAFLGSYIKRRAEHAALEADFDAVKRQLHDTTVLTESIKTDVKRLSDRSEKLRWLKQEKLEEYVVAVLKTVDYYSEEMRHRFFDADLPVGDDPWKTATMLQTLYLPELAGPHAALSGATGEFTSWVAQGMRERLEAWKGTGQKAAPSQAHCDKYSEHLAKMNAAVIAIQKAAQTLAGELTKV